MSRAQHTPGPWFCDGRLPGSTDYAVFAEAGVACIAFVKPGCLPAHGRDCAAPANARLIAAAPDLLAALEEILGPLNVCRDNPNVRDDQTLPVDFTMAELRMAWAAIAKARGQ